MKIAICQIDPIVGDIEGNTKKLENIVSQYCDNIDLVVFPELYITGYPPRDLLEKRSFIEQSVRAIKEICTFSKKYHETGILFGAPLPTGKNTGKGLYNSALLVYNGEIIFTQHKSLIPTYDVFDESRYFDPAEDVEVVKFKKEILGISICEDAWNDPQLWGKRLYNRDPIEILAKKGATLFINISSSPFYVGKDKIRYKVISTHAKKHKIPFIYVNLVGGNDELIFDGKSLFLNGEGKVIEILPSFQENIKIVDTAQLTNIKHYIPENEIEAIYKALILGIKDYMYKCNFQKAVIGISGGIDSAVTCCLAVEALGNKNVIGVCMPSEYTSRESIEYSQKLASNLGIELKIIPITSIYKSYIETLQIPLGFGKEIETAMENIQARIRGNILMAFSNKYGYLVLSTGNKSELATGYCTLYGDMTGGLAVISDVPKTTIYKLAEYINRNREVIPVGIIKRAPTAELKPGQTDQDTLPPYDILDQILHYYIEEGYSSEQIKKLNFDPAIVDWVIKTVNKNEYKRYQAPPGLKVTSKAFGIGRRIPIAAKYNI